MFGTGHIEDVIRFVEGANYEVEWYISIGERLVLNMGSKVTIGADYTVNDLLNISHGITCCIVDYRVFFAGESGRRRKRRG